MLVGDAVRALTAARAATTGSISGITFNATGGVNGKGQIVTAPTSLDNITLNLNDRVLVKDQTGTSATGGAINGVYVVTSVGTTRTWDRVAELDDSAEASYGTQIRVTAGTVNTSRTFFLTSRGATINSTPLEWTVDVVNPSSALLTDAAVVVGRDVRVTATGSTGTATLGGNSADASEFAGQVTLDRNAVLTAAAGGKVTFSGTIDGSGGVTKTGLGTIVLSTGNAYLGTTTVSAGTLLANNASGSATGLAAVTVGNSATLGGDGRIAGNVTVANGGTLAPGNSPGTLNLDGTLTLQAGSILSMEVNGAAGGQYDQVRVGGGVSLAGGLDLLLNYAPAFGDTLLLIDNLGAASINGTLTGIAEGDLVQESYGGQDYDFRVSYVGGSGNDLVLTAVPEPSTWAMLGCGGLTAAAMWWRRRRTAAAA